MSTIQFDALCSLSFLQRIDHDGQLNVQVTQNETMCIVAGASPGVQLWFKCVAIPAYSFLANVSPFFVVEANELISISGCCIASLPLSPYPAPCG
jgi:hypothetical protein